MLRAPLYPLILTVIYYLSGHDYLAVVCIQALMGGLTVPLLAILGRRLFGDTVPAIVAGCLFACHPLVIFAAGLLYSETFYLFLLLFTYLCSKMAEGSRRRGWGLA